VAYKALKYVKCKHRVFRKYKDSNHPACMRASRKVRNAKFSFEKKLAENIKNYANSFIADVRGKSHATRKLGPITDSGGNLDSPAPLTLRSYGAIQICLLLLLLVQ